METKAHSLAHTKWLCKYPIVFTPKYRRKILFAQLRESIKEILQCLCKYKGVEILEGHLMPDHVHMLVSIPPEISVANFMGCLKKKSSLRIFDKHANLTYKFGNRKFWAEGYYVSTVGLTEATIKKYIQGSGTPRHYEREADITRISRVAKAARALGLNKVKASVFRRSR